MEGLLKSTKIPIFDGNREKFSQWAYTFLSVCSISGCKEALTSDNYNVPAENAVLDPNISADAEELKKRNL